MKRAPHLLLVLCTLWPASCDSRDRAAELDGARTLHRTQPFALTALLDETFAALGSDAAELTFQALDPQGEPLPFALVDFAWDEGGRMGFQSDELGRVTLRWEARAARAEATVWVRTIPPGHALAVQPRDEIATALANGELRIAIAASR